MDIDTCTYDEKEELPLPEFYRKYKDKFPMTAIVVGGHYGPTKWDDLPSDLVRIVCFTLDLCIVVERPIKNIYLRRTCKERI